MEEREILQKISIADERSTCIKCGQSIVDIGNIKFLRNASSGPRFREEVYTCKECGTEFIIRYDLFDEKGHVSGWVFSGDPNDLKYNWPDILSPEQKQEIAEHLKNCSVCNERLAKEIELDVWFASILHKESNK